MSSPELSLHCISCGYDIRNLSAEGACPECGMSIERSLAGDSLANADPVWLKRVVLGQRFLAIGLALWVLSALGGLTGQILIAVVAISTGQRVLVEAVWSVVFWLALGGGVLISAIAVFLVTMLDPRETLTEGRFSPRLLARYGIMAATGLVIIDEMVPIPFGWPWNELTSLVVIGLLGAAATVAAVNLLRVIAHHVHRIPAPTLARATLDIARRLKVRIPVLWGCMMLAAAPTPGGGAAGTIFGIVQLFSGCTALIFVIFLVIEFFRIMTAMNRASSAMRAAIATERAREPLPPGPAGSIEQE